MSCSKAAPISLRASLCPIGHFCPEGSRSPQPCEPGWYCPIQGLAKSYSQCAPGYFCTLKAIGPKPGDGVSGGICPAGNYCPAGSALPTPCPIGHYLRHPGSGRRSSCQLCPGGHYCDAEGLVSPRGQCYRGYYCPPGQSSPTPVNHSCPAGHHCSSGQAWPQLCPSGSYQDQLGAWICKPCPAGFYCDNSSATMTGDARTLCPAGVYCPRGTAHPRQFPCPPGTLSSLTGLKAVSECSLCPQGWYCSERGLVTPTGRCRAGYFCPPGSVTGTEQRCWTGRFCPEGSWEPLLCPEGSYPEIEGAAHCSVCPAGYFCLPARGLRARSGTARELCPEGWFCPVGSGSERRPCPQGSFSDVRGLSAAAQCNPCPGGRYCRGVGQTSPSGLCTSGYYCVSGSFTPTPSLTGSSTEPSPPHGDICPAGHYCPTGSFLPKICPPGTYNTHPGQSVCQTCPEGYYCPANTTHFRKFPCPRGHFCPGGGRSARSLVNRCPPGTFNERTGQLSPVACTPCPPGRYCQGYGNSRPTGWCAGGWYCTGGADSAQTSRYGGQCQPGFYCPPGSNAPVNCPAGSYCPVVALFQPSGPCKAGWYCPSRSQSSTQVPCPVGHYCPTGSETPTPCKQGTFSPSANNVRELDCFTCLAGSYCSLPGLSVPTPCSSGYYCPSGTTVKHPCPVGTYSIESGATNPSTCRSCEPGYWCRDQALSDYTRSPCPIGHFCPRGTGTPGGHYLPIPCPPGTHRSTELGADILDCWPCEPGTFNPFQERGSCIQCEPGMLCLGGILNKTLCPAGYYCNTSESQLPCPVGYYCPEGSKGPIPCPLGHYCPQEIIVTHQHSPGVIGAVKPVRCPLGYRERTGADRGSFTSCEVCPPGYYGNHTQRGLCLPCRSGVVCHRGATSTDPGPDTTQSSISHTGSYICPKGHYCPEASAEPVPCPKGTYSPDEGSPSRESCQPCPPGYYNRFPGQAGCGPCGSEAEQPQEGQADCICPGNGREFQASDSRCPCAVGYRMSSGRGKECVRRLYDVCREGTTRRQDGACLTSQQWGRHCSREVCARPVDYEGFNGALGLCVCRTRHVDTVCNGRCRWAQRENLRLICKGSSWLCITSRDGSKLEMPLDRIVPIVNGGSSLGEGRCPTQGGHTWPVYLVESTERGFLGVYDPDPEQLRNLLLLMNGNPHPPLVWTQPSANVTSHPSDLSSDQPWVGHRQFPKSSNNGTRFRGIWTPTACVQMGTILLFTVSSQHYPVYDIANLYNANSGFDWGGFRALAEEMRLSWSPPSLFSFRFSQPGVYVLQLSSNVNRKMYVKVMPVGGQCYEEGPFFPTTPATFTRSGIARSQNLHFKTDWIIIFGTLIGAGIILAVCAALLVVVRGTRWPEKAFVSPDYRARHKAYSFDDYSSKGSAVTAVKKCHRRITVQGAEQESEDSILRSDEFWDHEEQVDLEGFSASAFYETLRKQSVIVSLRLGEQKDEVKALYQKLVKETDSLRELWMKRMRFSGRAPVVNSDDLETYEKLCHKIEREVERRKRIGMKHQEIVNKQWLLIQTDWRSREEHGILFNAAMREAIRLLEESAEGTDAEESSAMPADTGRQRVPARVEDLLSQLSDAMEVECRRLDAWAVLGEGTGAQVVAPGTTGLLSREELIGSDGTIRACDVLQMDLLTGLLVPGPDTEILLGDKRIVPVPRDCFLHPQTGRVLPTAGNIHYDSVRSRLVPMTDSATGDVWKGEECFLPYVPYPLCPDTGLPVRLRLPSLRPVSQLRLGGPMPDPVTGIRVPILVVTLHPRTGLVCPLGGTYLSPVTETLAPIEIGAMMSDTETGQIVPILGVDLNPNTGEVVPVGGVWPSWGTPMVLGDPFAEPLSGKWTRISGAGLEGVKAVPCGGGYLAMLDSATLTCELRALQALREYRDSIVDSGLRDAPLPSQRLGVLKNALEELAGVRARGWAHLVHTTHNLETQRQAAGSLASDGGTAGMIAFGNTGLLIPALIGMEIPDPGGSDLEVPILGVESDWHSGQLIPLAGTMEDPDGKGLIPIMFGARCVDPVTGEIAPVVGARVDPRSRIVLPVTQRLGYTRQEAAIEMFDGCDEELRTRRVYWQQQRHREGALAVDVIALLRRVLDPGAENALEKVEERARDLEDDIVSLRQSVGAEAQLRYTEEPYSATYDVPADIVRLVSQGAREEMEWELRWLTETQEILDTVTQFTHRVRQELGQHICRVREGVSPRERDSSTLRYQQVKTHLMQELQRNLMSRQTEMDLTYSRLEHARALSELYMLEARGVLTGSLSCYGDYHLGVRSGSPSSSKNLLRLLKQLLSLMEVDRNRALPQENPNPVLKKGAESHNTRKGLSESSKHSLTLLEPVSCAPAATSVRVYAQRQASIRLHIERHVIQTLSLETSLLTEEMKVIYRILEKMRHGEDKEVSEQLKNSLADLSQKRRVAKQMLCDRQTAEVTEAGLVPALVIPKNILETDEDVMSNLNLLVSDCQESVGWVKSKVPEALGDKGRGLMASILSDGNSRAPVPGRESSQEDPAALEAERLQTGEQLEASKLVTQDIQKQLRLYGTLEAYSELQGWSSCEIDGSLGSGRDQERDKVVAFGVAKCLRHEHVERLSLLLQAQSEERKRWRKPAEEFTLPEENRHEAVSGRTVSVGHREMLAKLDVKCKAEIRKELLFQHKERERLIEKQLRSREEQAMAASLAGGGRSEVQWMVQCLQVQRHLRRWVSLKHELHQLREQLTATTPGNTTSWPLVSEADEEMREVCEHAGGRPLALMELQEVTALLELRETSLLELADTLKKFTSHKGVVEAEDLAEELKSFRHERMKSLRLELEAMKSAKTAQREDRRHKQENQVKELEADLEEERKVDAEIMDQKRFEQQREQHLQAVEERMKLQDHLERGELTNPLRENLVEEQSESLGLQQTSLQQETVRIEKEQEARREQKRAWGLRHILEKMAVEEQEDDARYSCQIEHLLTEVTKDFQQAATFSPLRIPLLQAEFSHPGLQEGDQAQHLKSSPMLQHLQEADEKLEANLEPKVLGQSEDHQQEWSPNMARYQETDQPFIDLLDAQWTCEGELIPVNPERLSLTEFVVYRFGTFIVQLMKRSINAPEVSLLLACSLPRNDYTYNAFRNSFFYQHSERRLFIRRQRLKSLGDFALLLAHCLAHVTADELSDDTNPLFLRLFHQAVKALFNYMFSTRLCLTPASQACELSRRSRDNPYRGELCSEEYFDTISELLNLNMKEATQVEFSAEKLQMCEEAGTSRVTGKSLENQGITKTNAERNTQRLWSRIRVQESNGDGLESRAELERERIEEKIDNLTAELTVALQSVLTMQENAVAKKQAFLEQVRELEAELDSWENVTS